MKYPGFFFVALSSALLSFRAIAGQAVPVIPMQQNLTAVVYSSANRQTGCGLRITGLTEQNLSLNVLITVFMKDTGITFGVIKVVARKVNVKDSALLLQDGEITYTDMANIRKAWIKTDSGKQPLIYQNGESSHNDAYMASAEFASTVDLLVAISQGSFKVGLNRNENGPDEIFQFDKRLDQSEADKLSVCMKNLRTGIEENKSKNTF